MSGWLNNLFRRSLVFRLALLGMMFLGPKHLLKAQFPAENPAAACSRDHMKNTAKVGQFVFMSYSDKDAGTACLQILSDGKVIFRRTNDNGGDFIIGQPADKDLKVTAIANGTDITGRGHPDMIVAHFTGGAHCCQMHYVFELEPTFRLLATLDAEDDDLAHFADLDSNHHYYYIAADWTFAYWPGSFAGSPSAPVVLQFVDDTKGGGYHLALDKMHRPEPTPEEWRKSLRDARQTFATDSLWLDGGVTIWQTVLNLIYSGHSDLAWKFVDESWPAKTKGKNDGLDDFCSILKSSPYWPDIEPTVQNAPPACANAKPSRLRK
jgi:hypothetical protein